MTEEENWPIGLLATDRPDLRSRRMSGFVIAYLMGTRPNIVKMAPVIAALRDRLPTARHVCIHSGQHYDPVMSEVFFEELGLPAPDHALGVGSGPHGQQTGRALERIEDVLLAERPDLLVVPGDVNSSLAGAIAAAKLGVPVAHLESGLRSFDWTMPEEINRVLIDQISDWCFVHSPEAEDNLLREGVAAERIHAVGNTMIDSLVVMRPRAERSMVHTMLGLPPRGYLLVTLHRPALVDGPLLPAALAELERLSERMPVVFPMHPRTRACAGDHANGTPALHLIEPLGYVDFLALTMGAAAVVTDSGGIQEETTYLGVPCFTLRDNTERPVTLTQGTNRLLGLRIDALRSVPDLICPTPNGHGPPAGWDGHAGERVAGVLGEALEAPAALALGRRCA
jgi:UDP-N-acetylglucosamine 2-epimerase (non-hydrolysing)